LYASGKERPFMNDKKKTFIINFQNTKQSCYMYGNRNRRKYSNKRIKSKGGTGRIENPQ
jgi:hypothetical protein